MPLSIYFWVLDHSRQCLGTTLGVGGWGHIRVWTFLNILGLFLTVWKSFLARLGLHAVQCAGPHVLLLTQCLGFRRSLEVLRRQCHAREWTQVSVCKACAQAINLPLLSPTSVLNQTGRNFDLKVSPVTWTLSQKWILGVRVKAGRVIALHTVNLTWTLSAPYGPLSTASVDPPPIRILSSNEQVFCIVFYLLLVRIKRLCFT